MRNIRIQKLVLAAMFFAIGLVLPFITGEIPQIGQMLLPMHLPVFLCSLIVGWPYGLAIGFLLPLVRSLLFVMPPLYPNAIAMAFELACYGFFSGFLYRILLKAKLPKLVSLLTALIVSMIIGRLVWGAVTYVLFLINGKAFTFEAFLAGAVLNAVPGIILQIVLIPAIVLSLDAADIIPWQTKGEPFSAK